MPRKSTQHRPAMRLISAEIANSITKLKEFYATGVKSLQQQSGRMDWAAEDDKAMKHGAREMRRKAHMFADAKNGGYSRGDLQTLFRDMKNLRCIVGISHVIRLLTITDKKARAEIQREMVLHDWSRRQLDAAIRERFGNRNPAAGRRSRVAQDPSSARYELLRLSQQWQRACDVLLANAGPPPPAAGDLGKAELQALAKAREAVQEFVRLLVESEYKAFQATLIPEDKLFDEE